MGHQKYLFNKGGNFYFRRRIPGLSTITSPLFLSLGTKNEIFAHTWLFKLTMEVEDMLDAFLYVLDELPEELIARYMVVRLRHAISDIRRQHRMERMTGRVGRTKPENLEVQKIALGILLRDGIQKVFPAHRIRPDWSAQKLEAVMHVYREEAAFSSSPALKRQISEEFLDLTGVIPKSFEHHAQILEVYLHAKIESLSSLDDQLALRRKAYRNLSGKLLENHKSNPEFASITNVISSTEQFTQSINSELQPVVLDSKNTLLEPIITPGVKLIDRPLTIAALNAQFAAAAACDEDVFRSKNGEPFGADLAGACERSIKIAMAAGKMDPKTADSRRAKIKLFCLLTSVQTVTEIEQYHLRIFEEKLENLPRNFNKSYKDADLTLTEINARADGMEDGDLGRSASTYNSHVEMIGAVLKHAKAFDHSPVDSTIDTKLVRRPENKRARRKRNSFKPAEVKILFQHTVWKGCKSADRRHEEGDKIEKDGLYYVPLIVAYTGGRMEEIAGLTSDAIIPTQSHYGFDIRPHDERRLKNLQSERTIPVHEHLIELGLLEHQARMQQQGQKYLFPELLPTSSKKKFLSALRHNWRKLREIQLNGNPRGLDGHSLRHAFNQFLKVNKDVLREVRLDILGHAGVDLNDEVYGDEDGMPFEMKKAAIDLQPRVF